jgi:hypothetical protein
MSIKDEVRVVRIRDMGGDFRILRELEFQSFFEPQQSRYALKAICKNPSIFVRQPRV